MSTIFRENTATREDCLAVAVKLNKLSIAGRAAHDISDREWTALTDARVNAILDVLDLLEIPYEAVLGTHNDVIGWNVNGQLSIDGLPA